MTAEPLSEHLVEAFVRQGTSCRYLGSPFTAMICEAVAQRGLADSSVRELLETWSGDPTTEGDALPVRFCGALHELVLADMDPELAAVYPPNHDATDAATLHDALNRSIGRHHQFMAGRMENPPQTNEIRRSAAIYAGLMHIASLMSKPIVLSEIGASAGLNLLLDQYAYRLGNSEFGSITSPVRLEPEWRGPQPKPGGVTIVDRRGCDLSPFDLAAESHRIRLLSYIWADQHDRLSRLRAALEIAADQPVDVDAANAVDWLEQRLAVQHPGRAHVVYHSIAWQYLKESDQRRAVEILENAGARSTPDAPLFLLGMEGDGRKPGASLTLRAWPTGEETELARVDFHGRWIEWKSGDQHLQRNDI